MKNLLFIHRVMLLLALVFVSVDTYAWWNDAWPSRKQLTIDASITGADIQGTVQDFPILVRLHSGNFGYFFDLAENGKDLRFMQQDKTAFKHDVEKIDALTELGLVWVKLPTVRGGISSDNFTMYYGNTNAASGSDPQGIYDVNQSLVYHFKEGEALPQDATAYLLHASDSKAVIDPNGYIAAAARFEGLGGITVEAHPATEIDPENGWTFSTWIKTEQEQTATILQAKDDALQLEIKLQGTLLQASYQGGGSSIQTDPVNLSLGQWQHLALVVQQNNLLIYLDGKQVAQAVIALKRFSPTALIGSSTAGSHLIGWLDEVQIAKTARSADWVKLQFRSQSPDFTVLNFGSDESADAGSGVSYGLIILENLTVDGWVVIGLCGVMLVVSLLVMVGKGITLRQAKKDNEAFLEQYRNINVSNLDSLDHEESEEDKELKDSEFLTAMFGKHDHFQGSPIYRVYHVGVQELHKRANGGNTVLSSEALNVIRARLDAAVVREYQYLNKNLVLLTISISGGPFLGLLGTVMGVMITFAVIAATGEVNINSIAPGISAALAATVAGLAVAIPTLFAYNYLLVQVKDITADMRVFTDEFLAVVSERIAERQKRG